LDSIQVVQYVQRAIKDRKGRVLAILESGSLNSMEQYKYLMGEQTALDYIAQELSDLLNQQEQQDV